MLFAYSHGSRGYRHCSYKYLMVVIMATSTGLLNPPPWDESTKEFSLWLKEIKAWKLATKDVSALKNVHGLQLVLNLPEGSEIRRHLFDMLDTEQMTGDDGWKRVIELLESYYKEDDNAEAFETWKEFRTLCKRTTKLLKII